MPPRPSSRPIRYGPHIVSGSSDGTTATAPCEPAADEIAAMPPDDIVAMLSIEPEAIVSADATSRQLAQRPPGASAASDRPHRGQVVAAMSAVHSRRRAGTDPSPHDAKGDSSGEPGEGDHGEDAKAAGHVKVAERGAEQKARRNND